jgi:peptide-methionine (S)-S-oxide reductase
MQKATFAAGCFWGVEAKFRSLEGVQDAISGYTGGDVPNPGYKLVCTGNTGHAEAVEVTFDPQKISYQQLLDIFFEMHNPTTLNRQGPDIGTQYRSAVFFHSDEQERLARETVSRLSKSGRYGDRQIVTQIIPAAPFFAAEEYHQRYFEKQGIRGGCHI